MLQKLQAIQAGVKKEDDRYRAAKPQVELILHRHRKPDQVVHR